MATISPNFSCKWTSKPIFNGDVHVLAFSPCGTFLAIGGENGKLIFTRCNDANFFLDVAYTSSLQALAWNPRYKYEVVVGYADGALKTITLTENHSDVSSVDLKSSKNAIDCIAIDTYGSILAVGTGGVVNLWKYQKDQWIINGSFSPPTLGQGDERPQRVIRSVHIMKTSRDVVACFRDHGIICVDSDGNVKWSMSASQTFGSMSIDPDSKYLAVSDLQGCVDIYEIASNKVVSSFDTRLGLNICIPSVYVGEMGFILCCSDIGTATIWDTQSGSTIQVLRHGTGGLVMATASGANSSRLRIATATTGTGTGTRVKMWQAVCPQRRVTINETVNQQSFHDISVYTYEKQGARRLNQTPSKGNSAVTCTSQASKVSSRSNQRVLESKLESNDSMFTQDSIKFLVIFAALYFALFVDYSIMSQRLAQVWDFCGSSFNLAIRGPVL